MSTISFPSQRVGDFTITAISDGYLSASLDLLSNITPSEAAEMQSRFLTRKEEERGLRSTL